MLVIAPELGYSATDYLPDSEVLVLPDGSRHSLVVHGLPCWLPASGQPFSLNGEFVLCETPGTLEYTWKLYRVDTASGAAVLVHDGAPLPGIEATVDHFYASLDVTGTKANLFAGSCAEIDYACFYNWTR